MAHDHTSWLLSPQAVLARMEDPTTRLLDASWYLPASGRKALAEFDQGHISKAQFFDIDNICDKASPLPHMLPDEVSFSRHMSRLGIVKSDLIIVYDGSGQNFSAARVWWMFRVFGCATVRVMDGGLPGWVQANLPLTTEVVDLPHTQFDGRINASLVSKRAAVFAAMQNASVQIVDARPAGRFLGREPEPRPGLRSGHIPGSVNIPFAEMMGVNGQMLTRHQLQDLFKQRGVDLSRKVIVSCGSGVSACAVALGLSEAGASEVAVYDGSWAEWGADPALPVA